MATALNVFKTITADLTTLDRIIYTAPPLKTAIFLSIQATNVGNNLATFSFFHASTANVKTALTKNFKIPTGDSASVIGGGSGKLVLETGQKVIATASENNSVQLVMSVLESAND
jgi:hypothetical protein